MSPFRFVSHARFASRRPANFFLFQLIKSRDLRLHEAWKKIKITATKSDINHSLWLIGFAFLFAFRISLRTEDDGVESSRGWRFGVRGRRRENLIFIFRAFLSVFPSFQCLVGAAREQKKLSRRNKRVEENKNWMRTKLFLVFYKAQTGLWMRVRREWSRPPTSVEITLDTPRRPPQLAHREKF